MGRTKGALNKQLTKPAVLSLSPAERVQMIADLLIDIIGEELCLKP
jgi:hypothetical protein